MDIVVLKDWGVGIVYNFKVNIKDMLGFVVGWEMYKLEMDVGLGMDGFMSFN